MPLSLPLLNIQLGARSSTMLVTYLINHDVYKANQLESTFVEIITPPKSNIVTDCLYKHPNMDVLDFKNKF